MTNDMILRGASGCLGNETPIPVTYPSYLLSAFGSLAVTEIRPEIQIDAVYGLRPKTDTEIFSANGGSVTEDNSGTGNNFLCSTGTNIGGYGLIRSKRAASYRPGQGLLLRFTAGFSAPVALGAQRAGGINSENELSFGYSGLDFGIFYKANATLEIQTLTITTPASGSETATITLAGVAYTVNLTSGTAAHNAFQIASDSDFAVGSAWRAYQNSNTVIFIAQSLGDKTGTFSFSSSTAVASLTETRAGTLGSETFITQDNWNYDTMDGNGPSGMILDPSKGNVFQIRIQYLGYGSIKFFIENPASGEFVLVHDLRYANNYTSPSLGNPSFKIGWFAASLGSTTNIYTYGASGMVGIEGGQQPRRLPNAQAHEKSGVGTSFTNIITIRNRNTFQSRVNLSEVLPTNIEIAVDGTKISSYQIILNAVLSGETNWIYEDKEHSVVEYDVSGVLATLGSNSQLILSGVLGKTASLSSLLIDYDIHLIPGDTITLAVRTTSGTTDAAASITWLED